MAGRGLSLILVSSILKMCPFFLIFNNGHRNYIQKYEFIIRNMHRNLKYIQKYALSIQKVSIAITNCMKRINNNLTMR